MHVVRCRAQNGADGSALQGQPDGYRDPERPPRRSVREVSRDLIEDEVLRRVDEILARVDGGTELEIIRYAA